MPNAEIIQTIANLVGAGGVIVGVYFGIGQLKRPVMQLHATN